MTIQTTIHKAKAVASDMLGRVDWGKIQNNTKETALWLAKTLHIRQRYLFTKENKLRLRYVASAFCLLAATSIFAITLSQNSTPVHANTYASLTIIENEKGTGFSAFDHAQKSVTELLDTSRYGQLTLASATAHAIPQPKNEMVKIKSGDALGVVLQNRGVGASETNKVIKAMAEFYDPRSIRVGQEIAMNFQPTEEGGYAFNRMQIEIDPIKAVIVERQGEDYIASLREKAVEKVTHAKTAEVINSVFGSAAKAGIPKGVVADFIRTYSWSTDFQRDIRSGDKIEVFYDSYETADGYVAKSGDIHYAKLTVGGVERPIYRFKMDDGRVDYFGPDGISIKRTLMKTPIDGARMSSGFGYRKHPVLGYKKAHKGVDFAAPRGTPIYAAGDGVVERASRFGSYGNYIRIRHNNKLKTAYAHLNKIKSGVRPGARVTQGEVIGYVGTTGRSTGPHLHYEVLVHDKQVNPRSVDLPTGEELTGSQLARFKGMVREMDRDFSNRLKGMKYADGSEAESKRYN
jgi:murein DD-endopeptidase MepM/ murein hydrolase activator NlpD